MSKPRSTRPPVSRSAVPISVGVRVPEAPKPISKYTVGFYTEVDMDPLSLSQSSTRSRAPTLKGSPKKGQPVHTQERTEEKERLDSMYGRETDQSIEHGQVDEDIFVYLRWYLEQLTNDEFEEYHKGKEKNKNALERLALTRHMTRSITRELKLLSIREPPSLEKIFDVIIQQARAPDRPSPERSQSSNHEIIRKCILLTWSSLEENPTSAINLYNNIYAAGWDDPTKEWLLQLKIPCSIVEGTSGDEEKKPMRSSSMTLDDMAKCHWVFYDTLPQVDNKGTRASTTNKKSQKPLHDITIHPREPRGPREAGKGQKSLGLHFNLLIELHGRMKQVSSSELYLPERWKFIGQMKARLPELALPDQYKRALRKSDRRQSDSQIHETSKTQTTVPVERIKKAPLVRSDDLSLPSQLEDVEQSNLEKDLYRLLQQKFPLTGNSAKDLCQAKELEKVVYTWNAMPRHLGLTFELCNIVDRSLEASRKVVWLSDKDLIQEDRMYRSGNVTTNERIYDCTISEQAMITAFLSYRSRRNALSEGEVESGSGAILQKFMTGEGITDKRNCQLPIPCHLRPSGACPRPDIFARVNFDDNLGWYEDLKPIIFGGECKTQKTQSKNTPAQLAVAFHATLIILILYYLDNRSCASDPLPGWLYLYGIEYTEHGFVVHVHFPYYKFEEPNFGWGFISAKFTDEFSQVFKSGDTALRLSALAFLFRMRSQGMFIMEKLKTWKRAPKVLVVLQKQAYEKQHGPLTGDRGMSSKRKKGPRVTI
ncbi:hypothetical protein CPB86DRAFT_874528 [Serendipita vermifera]|nr:hypothetical protein CPB86DRAFT_874528 [Serendipita vermifera]